MKYSIVTCGECREQTTFIVCSWPPEFFWCRYCGCVFTFEMTEHTNVTKWQLRGFRPS